MEQHTADGLRGIQIDDNGSEYEVPSTEESRPLAQEKRSIWRSKWLYMIALTVFVLSALFGAGYWLAGSGARSVSGVVDSYSKVYAGSDSTKDVADLVPLYASDATFRDVAADRTYEGSTEIKAALDSLLTTPGFDLTIEHTSIGSDFAVVDWTANGTKIAIGRLAQVSGVTVLQIAKGKIVKETWYYDPAKAPF